MISLNNISISFGDFILFNDISFNINERDRIGLVGKNGVGKTTLLKIISYIIKPTTGTISIPKNYTIGFLPQEIPLTSKKTVLEETKTAFNKALKYEQDIKKYTREISLRNDYNSPEYLKLITLLNETSDKFTLLGGNNINENIEKVLTGLGFKREVFNRPLKEFSGGWQMRVELAKILLQQPNLILLDEPTNHLDIVSIEWLEEFLSSYKGAAIVVSHDKAFLNNVTNRTIEIANGKIYDYKANYSTYIELRKALQKQQEAAYNNQQKTISEIKSFIEKFRYKPTKAKQVQSRIKMLDKIELIEIDKIDTSAIHFRFPPAPHAGKIVFEANELTKKYDDKIVLYNLNFSIANKDSIAFVGKNGEGKTTLARMIVGDLAPTSGKCKLGHNVKIGYYAQNETELLCPEKTVFQTIDEIAIGEIRPKIRHILGSFLFSGDAIEKKVKVLSGGEKARLALVKLLLKPVNLLVLDEPTNHLDIFSKEVLKNALLKYDGTLIIVSHDRDFLHGLTNKVFEFKNNTIKQHFGDIYDFLDTQKLVSLSKLE
ncbi:MAG TPA: ABC-F family ATP-binding cassette domain-containing protein [Bacteroidales bacterium]|nr:ABC-F family ATP-binding cassette domain-containing protein [Bacteroidales bacterium]